MSLDDPSQCQRLELYQGPGFPETLDENSKTPLIESIAPEQASFQGYESTKKAIENALEGYCIPDEKRFQVRSRSRFFFF